MKRRELIRNIALVSAGITLMPACNLEISRPVYENIPLDNEQWKLLSRLTKAILPKGELPVTTPETTPDFVLTMINDCFEPRDIQKYLTGLRVFQQYLRDEYDLPFQRLNPEQHLLLFSKIEQSELLPESLQYFLHTTKQLTVRHFTSSEYYLKNYLDFEFVPGRYLGCVRV